MIPPVRFRTPRRAHSAPQSLSPASLERAKSIATIFSAVAIPIVLTIAGYFIQRQLSDDGLKKDYVAIATGILKDDPKVQEPDLRSWAVRALEENSPVPFSSKAKAGLLAGSPSAAGPAWLGPPSQCLKAPARRTVYSELSKLEKEASTLSQTQLLLRMQEFVDVVVKQEVGALEANAHLECVQRWAAEMEKSDIEYRREIGAPSSKSIFEQLAKEREQSRSVPSPSTSTSAPQASSVRQRPQ